MHGSPTTASMPRTCRAFYSAIANLLCGIPRSKSPRSCAFSGLSDVFRNNGETAEDPLRPGLRRRRSGYSSTDAWSALETEGSLRNRGKWNCYPAVERARLPRMIRWIALAAAAAVYGLAAGWIFRRLTSASTLRALLDKMLASALEMPLFFDEPMVVWRAQRMLFVENLKLLRHLALPSLLIAAAFWLLYAPLERCFGRKPLAMGDNGRRLDSPAGGHDPKRRPSTSPEPTPSLGASARSRPIPMPSPTTAPARAWLFCVGLFSAIRRVAKIFSQPVLAYATRRGSRDSSTRIRAASVVRFMRSRNAAAVLSPRERASACVSSDFSNSSSVRW